MEAPHDIPQTANSNPNNLCSPLLYTLNNNDGQWSDKTAENECLYHKKNNKIMQTLSFLRPDVHVSKKIWILQHLLYADLDPKPWNDLLWSIQTCILALWK